MLFHSGSVRKRKNAPHIHAIPTTETIMKTRTFVSTILAGSIALLGCSGLATAQDLSSLKGMVGGGSSLTSGSTGNAAGIIQYCMKNNYLGGTDAASVKDKLMGKLGGEDKAKSNSGYMAGAQGLLQGHDGKSTNLAEAGGAGGMAGMSGMGDMKAKATKKACGMVLKQGKSML